MTVKKLMLLDDFTPEQRNLSFTVQGANQRASFVGRDHNLTFNTTQSKNCFKRHVVCQDNEYTSPVASSLKFVMLLSSLACSADNIIRVSSIKIIAQQISFMNIAFILIISTENCGIVF